MTPTEIRRLYPGGQVEWYQNAPRHKVTLTEPFYMAKYETTVAEFKRFVDATGCKTTAEREGNAWGFDGKAGKYAEINGLNRRKPGF